jgi:hypothetical protein
MLSNQRLIDLLTNDTDAVRIAAARILSSAHDPSPATAEDVQGAIDHRRPMNLLAMLHCAAKLPQTDASIAWWLRALTLPCDPAEPDPDDDLAHAIETGLAAARLDVLERNWASISTCGAISSPWRERLQRRLTLAAWPMDDLWRRHVELADGDTWNADITDELVDLAHALALRAEAVAERVVAALRQPADVVSWSTIQLAGHLRLRAAAPILAQMLIEADDEASDIGEPLMYALIAIGDPAVIGPLASRFADLPWGTRLYMTEVLEHFRCAESERALITLLQDEADVEVASGLAIALCQLGTEDEHALSSLRAMAREDRCDPMAGDLRSELLVLGEMIGREFEESAQWRRQLAEERLYERRTPAWNLELRRMNTQPAEEEVVDPPLIETVRREQPKVGRNDPCPCGSGRKHKKCCLPSEMRAAARV